MALHSFYFACLSVFFVADKALAWPVATCSRKGNNAKEKEHIYALYRGREGGQEEDSAMYNCFLGTLHRVSSMSMTVPYNLSP